MSQKIRIKLKSYDHNLVDKSAEKIVKTVKATGAVVSGPIPLPTHKRIFTVNRSTFVNKKSREQFQLSSFKRLIDIYAGRTAPGGCTTFCGWIISGALSGIGPFPMERLRPGMAGGCRGRGWIFCGFSPAGSRISALLPRIWGS